MPSPRQSPQQPSPVPEHAPDSPRSPSQQKPPEDDVGSASDSSDDVSSGAQTSPEPSASVIAAEVPAINRASYPHSIADISEPAAASSTGSSAPGSQPLSPVLQSNLGSRQNFVQAGSFVAPANAPPYRAVSSFASPSPNRPSGAPMHLVMPGVHPPPSTIYTIQPPKPTVVYGASAGISSQSSASSSSTLQTAPKLKAPDVPRGRPPNSAKGTRPAQPVNNPPTVTIGSYRTKLPDSPIYMAVYSGVSVYEKIIRGVPVMKRVDDYYMNATHILKVAGFTKPKRTKILEKEVLQGHHEKVQGGYGKYQGTWIPRQIAKSLAKQYGVDQVLKDIFDYTGDSSQTISKSTFIAAATAAAKASAAANGNRKPTVIYNKAPPVPTTALVASPLPSPPRIQGSPNRSSVPKNAGDESLSPSLRSARLRRPGPGGQAEPNLTPQESLQMISHPHPHSGTPMMIHQYMPVTPQYSMYHVPPPPAALSSIGPTQLYMHSSGSGSRGERLIQSFVHPASRNTSQSSLYPASKESESGPGTAASSRRGSLSSHPNPDGLRTPPQRSNNPNTQIEGSGRVSRLSYDERRREVLMAIFEEKDPMLLLSLLADDSPSSPSLKDAALLFGLSQRTNPADASSKSHTKSPVTTPSSSNPLNLALPLDSHCSTALHFACAYARLEQIKALLSANADPCAADLESGATPLHKCVAMSYAYDAQNFAAIVTAFEDATVDKAKTKKENDGDRAVQWLDYIDGSKNTILHAIAKRSTCAPAAVESIAESEGRLVALYYARCLALKLSEHLHPSKQSAPERLNTTKSSEEDSGSDSDDTDVIEDENDEDAASDASEFSGGKKRKQRLQHGRSKQSKVSKPVSSSKVRLDEGRISEFVNAQNDDGDTALHICTRSRCKPLIQLLLQMGADKGIRNKNGRNPVDEAGTDSAIVACLSAELPDIEKSIRPLLYGDLHPSTVMSPEPDSRRVHLQLKAACDEISELQDRQERLERLRERSEDLRLQLDRDASLLSEAGNLASSSLIAESGVAKETGADSDAVDQDIRVPRGRSAPFGEGSSAMPNLAASALPALPTPALTPTLAPRLPASTVGGAINASGSTPTIRVTSMSGHAVNADVSVRGALPHRGAQPEVPADRPQWAVVSASGSVARPESSSATTPPDRQIHGLRRSVEARKRMFDELDSLWRRRESKDQRYKKLVAEACQLPLAIVDDLLSK